MHHDLDHLDEKRIKPIEERAKEFRFVGQWQEGKTYRAGNFVSMGGHVYHANADTTSRPGTGRWPSGADATAETGATLSLCRRNRQGRE